MNKRSAFISSLFLLGFCGIVESAEPPYGSWALTGPSGCSMTFELNPEGHLKRTSAQLEYTTKVQLKPEGDGWLLEETLETQNGQLGCNGQPGEEVVKHLHNKAYVERRGGELHYRVVKGGKRVLKFKQRTQPDARSDGPAFDGPTRHALRA